jgi:glutamine amidotransferase
MTIKKIVILDYDTGNILSIKSAILFHGYEALVTRDHKIIESASHIILPGVGAFPAAMKKLMELDLIESLIKAKNNNAYILGICLGMQLLFTDSEEFEKTKGLNLIKGNIIKINKFNSNLDIKLPNIGWRNCKIDNSEVPLDILNNISESDKFYFIHSYVVANYEKKIKVFKSVYQNIHFPAVINYKNIYGCQFHPEKSGPQGLRFIKNFINL